MQNKNIIQMQKLCNAVQQNLHEQSQVDYSRESTTFTSCSCTCMERLTNNFMVCDNSFSCALHRETLRVRGATRYAFIARPCPGPGGPRDERRGHWRIAPLRMRTPFTNSARSALSDPLFGTRCLSTTVRDFRVRHPRRCPRAKPEPTVRGPRNENRMLLTRFVGNSESARSSS